MVLVPTQSQTRIVSNRKFDDYRSLKKYWSKHGRKVVKEVLYTGYQTATNAAAEWVQIGDTIAFLGANGVVFAATEADLAALDGDSLYMDYVSSTGVLYENVETKYDSVTSTATEVPIGCQSAPYLEAVSAVAGDNLTMTAIVGATIDQYAGWFVIGAGDATHRPGSVLEVLSSTVATPVVLTMTTTPNADWADDNVSLQPNAYNDVYRIRRIWAETESPTDNYQCIADKDQTNIYAVVADANVYGSAGSRYFSLSSDYTCYLGKVDVVAPAGFQADNESLCHALTITYTPVKETGTTTAADITLKIEFNDHFHWEPCIELEPATEVIFKIHKILNSEDFIDVTLDYTVLEVIL